MNHITKQLKIEVEKDLGKPGKRDCIIKLK